MRAGAVLACAGAALAIGWWFAPGVDLAPWRSGPPPHRWASWQRQEERWREEGLHRSPEQLYAPLERIGEPVASAVLLGEDISFLDHGPVDLRAMGEALVGWWRGSRLRGASTISQQLAKTLFLSPERSVARKLSEVRLAWWLERSLGKRRTLELYLNVVEFGPGLFGADAAARHYYGKTASALDEQEAAGLAASIPAPGRDNPTTDSPRWRFRRDTIRRRMERAEWLRRRVLALVGAGPGPGLVNREPPH